MNITLSRLDDYTVLRLDGRLDLNGSAQLKERIGEISGSPNVNLVLDLRDVSFINSSGLGALVSISRDMRMSNRRMALCNLATYVQEVFEITRLSHAFDIYSTVEEAVIAFAEAASSPK